MQMEWARCHQLVATDAGYLPKVSDNLYRPLSKTAKAGFYAGSGNELKDSAGRPAKMRALHSSSALAVNFFDPLAGTPERVLSALGSTPSDASLAFEGQFPTGLGGNPPNLDLCLRLASGQVVGVESKFTEWLTPKPIGTELFKPKYFDEGRRAWGSRRLHRSQLLAEALHRKEHGYRYLHAAQLLKHALGLACSASPFELVYVYYDVEGPESAEHRDEVADFASRIADDFQFRSTTYQDVFRRMRGNAAEHDRAHLDYLSARYCPN